MVLKKFNGSRPCSHHLRKLHSNFQTCCMKDIVSPPCCDFHFLRWTTQLSYDNIFEVVGSYVKLIFKYEILLLQPSVSQHDPQR